MEIDFYNEIRSALDESRFPKELLDGYELLECLSYGENHETLLVRSKADGTLCVAKCYLAGHPMFPETEPVAIQQLSHPALPRFVCEYTSESMRCLLRHYVEGQTLDKIPVPVDESVARSICSQLCNVLSYIHTQTPPIIHRDIKPQNVIICDGGKISLIDFGISRVFNEDATGDTIVLGTQAFAPPEQYGFSQTDCRSDIYSLGMLLRWLITGNVSHEAHGNSPLERIASKCTAFDPEKRYKSADDVLRAIRHHQPEQSKKRKFYGALLVLLILALASINIINSKIWSTHRQQVDVHFSEPLIEHAVRTTLGKSADEPFYEDELSTVTAIYIMADRVFTSPDEFYSSISEWYAGGKIRRGDIRTLADVEQLPNLVTLCIVAQELDDISALSTLAVLEKVEFKHNYIEDITPLGELERLVAVGLNDNPVADLSPLLSCPRLRYLDLCSTNDYAPNVIAEMGDFKFLDIANTTQSYRYLAGKTIQELKLGYTKIHTLEFLAEVNGLESLDINNTAVTDLTELTAHQTLKHLRLSGLRVDNLSILLELPNLETVTLSRDMESLAEAFDHTSFIIIYE